MEKIEKILAQGGKRWQKNGMDRIYLSKAIKAEDGMSRKVSNAFYAAVDKAYYDVTSDKLVYVKSAWPYVNERIESEFKRICQ